MDRRFLGRNWQKRPPDERLDGLLYIEHERSNIHLHGLVTKPYCNRIGLQLAADEIWSDLCESGSVLIKDIGSAGRRAAYCTKEFKNEGFFDRQFFLAREFMSKS